MSDGKVQLGAELDASGVKQGAAEVTGAVRQMGKDVEREAARVSAATSKMGGGSEQAAQSAQKAERSIIASIQRQTAAYEAGGRSTREYYEAIGRQRGIGADVLKPYLDQLDAAKSKQAEAAKGAKGFGDSLGMVRAGIGGIVGGALVGWAKQAGAALFDASVSAERLRTMLNFATGNSARDIEYLRGVTQSLGLEMQSTAAAYGQFAAAAKGTNLEGQKTKDVFESIAKASAVMGLSADQTSGVLLALQQMVSKGTVQAEELRGQLGERLPGAFQVAARAMGVTTAELGKMLESGSVVADDFLPKFAKALDEYVGDAAESAATRLEASQTRMSNAWERLMQAVGDSGVSSTMAVGMESAASSIDAIAVAMEAARRSGDGMGGQLLAAAGATLSLLDPTERLTVNLYDNERASKAAWERLRDLESQAARGVNVKAEYQQVINLINTLQIARHEMAKLRQEASGVATVGDRPRDLREDNPSMTRGASYARWAKEQAEAEKGLMDVRMKATGVNKSYFDDLGKYQAALRAGIITEKDYTAAVSKLATETWKSSAAGKAESESKKGRAKASDDAARAAEREVKAYQAFLNGLREKIAGQELELQNGKKLSAADRERLELEKLLANGRFQMTESRKAEIEAGLKRLDQLDQEREKVSLAVEAYKEWVDTQQELARAEVEASKGREAASRAIDEYIAGVVETQELLKLEAGTIGMTSEKRAVALAQMRVELELRKKIAEINANPNGNPEWRALEIERVTQWAQVEKVNAAQRAIYDEWQKTADSINQSLTDALLRGFEDGKDFGKNFRDTLMNMFKTLVLRPVISFVVQPISNAISGIVSGFLGGGQGGAGGIGGMVSNGSSLLNLFTGNSGGIGSLLFGSSAAYGLGVPGVSLGSQQAAMLAAQTGPFGWGGLSSTASAANISGASWMSSAAAGLAVVAAPLIIGALAESRTRDRFSGAAFATSNWVKDPTVTIGGAEYDPIKGILPDREALVGRALEAGISQDMIDRFKDKDRALLHYIRMLDSNRQSGNEGPPINVNALLENDNMYAADWYRGQGYTHPQAMGWWNDKGYDLNSNDPAVTTASRAVATSIVGPLTEINRILGGAADDFRVTAGYATRGAGNGVWAGLNISQGENNLVDWVNMDDFRSPQEAVKGMYEQALVALEKLDLPEWAQEQVDGAQAAMAGLKGDKMGEEAAALYAQTAGSIAQTLSAIKMLIDVFPDFANATQDSVHALAELMGGMDNLQSAYSTYIGAFWSEGERQSLMTAQLTAQLAELGQTMPTTAEGFRRMVEDALAAGESGNALAAALLGMSGAMAQVLGQTQAVTFGASQELAGAIQAGLLGTFDGENLGAFMAQTVSDGIYNAIAGGFAAQITDIIVQGVVNPVIQAALTGSSVSAAVSAASIESMVAQAQAVAQAAATVLNDPAIRDAIGSISSAVASINVPVMSAAPQYVRTYTDAVRDNSRAAETAAREAERLADAWRSIGDTLIDEVNRIRGVVADAGGDSLSYYQSLFAMDTAAARAGDQDAAGRLTGLSGDLLSAAEAQAGSLFELQQMRAWVAQSLQDTARYAYAKAGDNVPGITPAPVTAPTQAMFVRRPVQQDNGTRELNQQITVLTEQNQRQAAQLADLQLQLLRVFRRWDDEGMPPQREEEGVTP